MSEAAPNTFTITVAGQSGSGKSTILDLITKTLIGTGLLLDADNESAGTFARVQDTPEGEAIRVRIDQRAILDLHEPA